MDSPDTILFACEEAMTKAVDYLKQELRGMRTGRASPAMVEFIKIEAYGSQTDIKSVAAVSVPEPTQLLIKPFDTSLVHAIKSGIERANIGLNPMPEGKALRINIPAMSADRRQKDAGRVKKMGEECKVTLRNARRDANKHTENLAKNPAAHVPEDEIEALKKEIQDLLKKFETEVDTRVEEKSKEIMTM